MSRKILYFPISTADQNRIDPASIQVESGPADSPDSIRVRFTVTNPADGAPRVQPLFPGQLGFIPEAGGTLPDETTAFAFTSAEYATWQTRGTLLVDANAASMRAMQAMAARPALLPNRAAYWPVRLPESFLYGTLRSGSQLKHSKIHKAAGGSHAVGTADWQAQAVAGFFHNTYRPGLREDASDPAKDDVQQFAMPTVEMDPVTGAVELWMAGAHRPASAFLDDKQSGDLAAAAAALGVTSLDDMRHPLNGPVALWPFMQSLESEMIDADLLNYLADAITIRFPQTPRFFEFRFTLMGRPKENYHCGAFTSQRMVLRDSAGNVLQDRLIPLHGRVTVSQPPPAVAPPAVTLELAAGPLTPSADATAMSATGARSYSIDFTSIDPPRLALTPADLTRHGDILIALQSAPTTQTVTRQTLAEWEDDIRPAGWPPAWLIPTGDETSSMVFSGSRRPWAQMAATEINQFLAGLRHVVSGGAPPVPAIRPSEAILLWIMEGKVAGVNYKSFSTPARPQLMFKTEIPGFSGAQVAAASPSDIQTLVRVWALWNLWGLDDLNHHRRVHDNQPVMSGDLPTAVANHNAAFDAGRARITAAGLNPPTRDEVNDAFEVTRSGSDWKFRISPDHHEYLVWLQYTELQRRLILLPPNLTPSTDDVWRYPAFGYMSYNGGMETPSFDIDPDKTVFRTWTEANALMGVGSCAATNPQDALRCKKVTATEIAMIAPPHGRRGSSRINGMHVAALSESFALVYPYVI